MWDLDHITVSMKETYIQKNKERKRLEEKGVWCSCVRLHTYDGNLVKKKKNKKKQRQQVHWIQYLVVGYFTFQTSAINIHNGKQYTEAPNIIGCYHSNLIS